MYCSHCGGEVREDAVVCIHCGCALNNSSEKRGKSGTDLMAIFAFVLSFIMPVVGLILSIIAKNNLKTSDNATSKNFATAAFIISLVEIIAVVLVILFCLMMFFLEIFFTIAYY